MGKDSLLLEFTTSGLGVGVATACTNPIDVVKVRMQLSTLGGGLQSPGLLSTTSNLIRTEGMVALGGGMGPAVARAVLYGGVRLGLYGPIKGALSADQSFGIKLAAGTASGAIAAAASNPMDLVKTRLQVGAKDASGQARSSMGIMRDIVRREGVGALWKGTVPGATRAAVLTASQCATYDEVKQAWMRVLDAGDTMWTHLGASMITGLVSTTATAPVDVVKTYMFVGGAKYSGPMQCAMEIVRREGARSMFKGWTANYARLGPQTTIIFVVVEKLRSMAGMDSI